jgi:pentapeptide MXKDX repeat protein
MKRLINGLVCAGFILAGGQAFADDAMQADTSHHQMMKDCMARHATKNDGMSKSDAKKACSDEMNMQTDHASEAKAPTDSPMEDRSIGSGETSNK